MWVGKPIYDPEWEPVELRILKIKLGNLSNSICKCLRDRPKYISPTALCIQEDEAKTIAVQVEEQKRSISDRFTQVNLESTNYASLINTCPTCVVTMNLLRRGFSRNLKDEESETYNLLTNDKSTEQCAYTCEKGTSFTSEPKTRKYSNLALCETVSRENSLHVRLDESKSKQHQVRFIDVSVTSPSSPLQQTMSNIDTCFCLEHFMNSIRPPMVDMF